MSSYKDPPFTWKRRRKYIDCILLFFLAYPRYQHPRVDEEERYQPLPSRERLKKTNYFGNSHIYVNMLHESLDSDYCTIDDYVNIDEHLVSWNQNPDQMIVISSKLCMGNHCMYHHVRKQIWKTFRSDKIHCQIIKEFFDTLIKQIQLFIINQMQSYWLYQLLTRMTECHPILKKKTSWT